MSAKNPYIELEELFKENAKDYLTYEKLVKYFTKQPNLSNAKKIESLAKKYKLHKNKI